MSPSTSTRTERPGVMTRDYWKTSGDYVRATHQPYPGMTVHNWEDRSWDYYVIAVHDHETNMGAMGTIAFREIAGHSPDSLSSLVADMVDGLVRALLCHRAGGWDATGAPIEDPEPRAASAAIAGDAGADGAGAPTR